MLSVNTTTHPIFAKRASLLAASLAVMMLFSQCSEDSDGAAPATEQSGQGGSLARFAIVGKQLFAVDEATLHSFDIGNPQDPTPGKDVNLGFGVETIFPYQGNVFIGTQTGMHIVDITAADGPKVLSTYEHVFACDPVVVQGDYAYVTLRSGTGCFRADNRLDVVDISDPYNPSNVGLYSMINPHGMGVTGNLLFVGEGTAGFKVFDITDPKRLVEIAFVRGTASTDFIPLPNNHLLMVGDDGIYQYDHTGYPQNDLTLLSKIPVAKR